MQKVIVPIEVEESMFKTLCYKRIADYLDPDLILFLDACNQPEALQSLISLLDTQGKLIDAHAFYTAILEREKIVSTGIGLSVAIPHAKLSGYDDFFICIGIQRSGSGIEWNALDKEPVRLIFLIGGPDDRQTDYLNILSMLTTAIKDTHRRKQLLLASSPHDILNLFKNC